MGKSWITGLVPAILRNKAAPGSLRGTGIFRCIIAVCRPLFTVKKRTNAGHCFPTVLSVAGLVGGYQLSQHGPLLFPCINTVGDRYSPVETGNAATFTLRPAAVMLVTKAMAIEDDFTDTEGRSGYGSLKLSGPPICRVASEQQCCGHLFSDWHHELVLAWL